MVGPRWRVVPVACAAALLLGGTALSQEAAARQDGRALCRELGRSGTAQDVPRLEALLADPSCADAARRALEQIPGDESLNALYGALDTAKGEPLIGVLSSLGERRDVRALPGIAEHLSSRGEGGRAAASAASGRIGGSRTGRRLLATESELPASAATQEALGHALLECADELRRAGEAEDARALYEALHDGRFPRAVRIGAFLGHLLMGFNLSMMSMFGIVALSGVVVNASLVLVHAVNFRRAQGAEFIDAVLEAGIVRFRPIVLTSLTTFLGLVPLMFEPSVPARPLVPMAIALGYGVFFASAVTLFLVPSAYVILDDLTHLGRKRRRSKPGVGDESPRVTALS